MACPHARTDPGDNELFLLCSFGSSWGNQIRAILKLKNYVATFFTLPSPFSLSATLPRSPLTLWLGRKYFSGATGHHSSARILRLLARSCCLVFGVEHQRRENPPFRSVEYASVSLGGQE